MEEEIWKTIPISTNYEASSHGRIRNKKEGNFLTQFPTPAGYRRVNVVGTNQVLVHRLVAITFIPNPDNKATVNHIKHGGSYNHVSNLEWCTHKEQNSHKRKRKLTTKEIEYAETWGTRKIWKCDNVNGDKLQLFKTVRDAANSVQQNHCMSKIFTVAENHEISNSVSGSRQSRLTVAGFKWQFDELRVLSTEEWRDLDPIDAKGAKGYQISSLGRLCSPTGEVRSPGGRTYSVHAVGDSRIMAHRLVALTFLPHVDGKNFVNHEDGNKNNPVVDNLSWVTQAENSQHAHDNGLVTPHSVKIRQFDLEGNYLQTFESVQKARDEVGFVDFYRSIYTSSAAGGYIWKYESDEKDQVVELNSPLKKVKQFSLDCVFIREFDSIKCAQKEVPGLQRGAVHTGGTSAGFRWRYSTDKSPFTENIRNHKKICQHDLQGNLVKTFESVKKAKEEHGPINVHRSINTGSVAGGYIWKRQTDEEDQTLNQFDMNGTFIRSFRSILHAREEIPGLDYNAAHRGYSAGYKWKYATDSTPFKKRTSGGRKKVNRHMTRT